MINYKFVRKYAFMHIVTKTYTEIKHSYKCNYKKLLIINLQKVLPNFWLVLIQITKPLNLEELFMF